MQVKDILALSAGLILRDDITNFLENDIDNDGYAKRDLNNLLRCYNLVENEIALEYLPLISCENLSSDNGIIYYQTLSNEVLDIISVVDENDNKVKFKIFNEYIKVKPGNLMIKYTFIPTKKTLYDQPSFKENNMPSRIIAMGIVTEFCLISGMYEEAVIWNKKYTEGLMRICKTKFDKKLPCRSWI